MRKRILSFFCVLALCLTMLPAQVLAVGDPASVSEIPYIDAAGLEQSCTSAEAVTDESSVWNSTESTWYVVNSNVTISDRITVTGNVHLILMDGASLDASAGITVNRPNSLTIYGQRAGTGTLIATAGDAHAGIGGSDGFAGGTITINGGIIDAKGGRTAAGIGGGAAGNGGTITINGGSVTATGGLSAAGIGGGWADVDRINGTTTITITGGTVTAYAGYGGAGIGDGNYYGGEDTEITISGGVITTDGTIGIGGYDGAYNGSFSMGEDGSAVIFAQSITDQSSKSQWNGVFFFGTSGTLYGSEVTLDTDVTIPAGYTLTVDEGKKLTVGTGVTVTNNGSIESYGQLTVHGTIENNPANLRIHLNLSKDALDLRFEEEITLTASGENLPAEGGIVQFFYGNYLLGETEVTDKRAVLTVKLPAHDEDTGVSCGSVQFRAEGGGAVGLLDAAVRMDASIIQLQVDSVTSGSITMGEVTLANGCDAYAPDIRFTYHSEDGTQQGTSDSPTITGLLPDTTYLVSAQIIRNDHYLDSAVSAPISVTTSPAQTTLPVDGLDLAHGAVTVEQGGETDSLIVRHSSEVYALDRDQPIPITGTWVGDTDADDRYHVPAPAISVGAGVTAHLVLSNVTIPLSTGGSFIMESISGVSINGGAVHLTLEGNNRILADMDGPMVGGMTGIKLNNSSTLTMDGDGFLTIGTPGGSVDEGISGYSSTINLDGGQVLAYERFSSTVTIQNKTAVTLQVTGTVQGAALSKEGGPVGGWYGVIPERGNAKLWIPNEDGTYRALLLVNGVIKQFEIVMTNGTPTVTPLSGNASVTLPPEAELPLMADSDGNLCLPGESIVQAGSGPEITVNGDGAAVNPEGEVALPGNGSATVADDSGNTTTITMPETGGTLVPGEDGVILPGGSTVQTGNGPAITVSGDGATVTPEGAVNLPSSGSVTMEDSSGNTTTITVPETGGTITPNEDSSVDIPAGSTVQTDNGPAITVTGNGATVTPEGAVNLPSSGSITVEDGSGNTTTITVPETGGTIIPNENGSVNLPGGSSAIISGPSGESTTIIIPEAGGTFDPSEGTITRYYTVTFDSKGGSSVDSIVVTENSPVTKPADPTREGYTFTGWYQDGACTVAWDFANKTVTANTTLYAGWKQVDDDSEDGGSDGGGSVGGSSSGSSSSVTGSGSNVSVTASGGSVTAYQMESAVKKADEGATITIKATGSSNISLPASGLESAADNDNSLTLDLRYGKVTLSPEALSSVADQAGSTVTITVAPVDTDELNSRQQAAVGDAPVFDLTIRSGSTVISDFGGGLATVSIPYELPSNQDPAGVVAWYMDDDGNITPCETRYDTRTETVIFTTRHFSKYVIGYEEPTVFTDVSEDSYYANSVLWAVENGVTNGTSATTFSPDMAVSRAQMVTFLWRAHGSPKATGTNPFTDVNTSDYYYDAVLWAVENGITVGTSDTTFSPDAPVTRAQAVTFQWRAAGSPVVSGSNFGDVASDAYYADAVTWAVANGITNGTGGNTFSPDAAVSRAQAVTFLWRELA